MILIWKTREKQEDFLENIGDDEDKISVCSMKNPSDEGGDSLLPEDDGLDNGSLSDLLEEQESDGGGDLDEWCCEDDNIENSSACEEVIDEMEEPGWLSESEGGPSGEKKRRKGDSSNTG